MFGHIQLLVLLFAPLVSYLAAAFIFSWVEKERGTKRVSETNMRFTDGQHF